MKAFGCSCLFLLLLGACATEEPSSPVGDTEAATTQAGSTSSESSTTSGIPDTATSSDAGSSTASESGSETTTEGSTGLETTGSATTGGTGSDSAGGSTGLHGFCERYFECGGSYHADVQACIDASTDYWGSCPEALAALDAFGDCMITIPCEDYDPDAYNPANTICSKQWSQVQQSSC